MNPEPTLITVALNETQFWELVDEFAASNSVFEEQGDEHGFIDGRLQRRIENVLVPILGPWEGSDIWYHIQDFFNNGVRSLLFTAEFFPWNSISALRRCLSDEAADFLIVARLCEDITAKNVKTVGLLGILQDRLIVSESLVQHLPRHSSAA
jgi:hypothetical protein